MCTGDPDKGKRQKPKSVKPKPKSVQKTVQKTSSNKTLESVRESARAMKTIQTPVPTVPVASNEMGSSNGKPNYGFNESRYVEVEDDDRVEWTEMVV